MTKSDLFQGIEHGDLLAATVAAVELACALRKLRETSRELLVESYAELPVEQKLDAHMYPRIDSIARLLHTYESRVGPLLQEYAQGLGSKVYRIDDSLEAASAHECLLLHAKQIRDAVSQLARSTVTWSVPVRVHQIDTCDYEKLVRDLQDEAKEVGALRDSGQLRANDGSKYPVFDVPSIEAARMLGYKNTASLTRIVKGEQKLPGFDGSAEDRQWYLDRRRGPGNSDLYCRERLEELVRRTRKGKDSVQQTEREERRRIAEEIEGIKARKRRE